jgi:integrase
MYPPEVSWINTHISIDKQDLPNNLPTEEDAKRMIEAAEHPRDKALIASLYESGCRVDEIAALRIGDINFDEYGAYLVVNGKTGSRRIRLVFSSPIIASWINVHPEKNNLNAPLWVVVGTMKNFTKTSKKAGKRYSRDWSYGLKYRAIASMLTRVAKKAGIRKKVNPHIWRHARATFLANKLTEQQLKHIFGWGQSSRMAATYVHLSGRDVDDALLAVYGMKKISGEEKKSGLTPVDCPRCKEMNEYSNVFCKKCGWILDKDAADKLEKKRKKADEIINSLTKDPESLKLIARAMTKLGLVDKLMKI